MINNTNTQNSAVEESQTDATARRARGEFVRGVSGFRSVIGQDEEFPPEPGRYHLFVALNCPWCHRVTLARQVLGLEDSITMDVAFPNRTGDDHPAGPNHWEFDPYRVASLTGQTLPECTFETATGKNISIVSQIYGEEGSEERSLPILFDKKNKRIVSNESAEIIRMLDANAEELGSKYPKTQRPRLYPGADNPTLARDINELNERIYAGINNGAYKAGFSSDQSVYAAAFRKYFDTLDWLEQLLASDDRPFLTGHAFTEADLRLFPTLFRHDAVYYLRMKLNGARILDYPHLWRWLCRVYQLPGVQLSGSLLHCRQGYFGRTWNGVVPLGSEKPVRYPDAFQHPELAMAV